MQRVVLTKRTVTAPTQSSQDDSSDVSDLEKFEEAYTDFGALTDGVDPQTLERDCSGHPNEKDLPGGVEALHSLANVPESWCQRNYSVVGKEIARNVVVQPPGLHTCSFC